MKKIIGCLLITLAIGQAKPQIIITGYMADPAGQDATNATRGYEYVQLMATQDITFDDTKNAYSVVLARNGAASTTSGNFDGWASGHARTFKFNLTAGKVKKGAFFYVGGPLKVIAGYITVNGEKVKSTDISETAPNEANRANWIRAIAYFNGANYKAETNTNILGDDFGGSTNDWIFNNATGGVGGIGVFSSTTVTGETVPIDAVFFGDAYYSANRLLKADKAKGFKVPDNDLYKIVNGKNNQPYFGQGTNTTVFNPQPEANKGNFAKLGGVYNTSTKKWTTPRSISFLPLLDGISTNAADATVFQLSHIETDPIPSKMTRIE